MSLSEKTAIDKIEIVGEFKTVQVREATQVYRDDVPIGNPEYHRYVITAGQDYSDQPEEVKAVCAAVHTPEVIAAYQATQVVEVVEPAEVEPEEEAVE
ncbi:hypothetical protein SAMN02745753_03733 [Marinomonas polaris DSM 16579]|uniref:Uncharacterized protein n=1 Tax=Marinomonas polaris DSM 16579 TaxID=1122206 RepID=A0A1M5J174_9GAMM|nr:hypothetical protein [Marinomonas polaris]SHG34125.1 hypothetical protein SAMN02745753_03733 [Marinomonas polaris DSM 16579]